LVEGPTNTDKEKVGGGLFKRTTRVQAVAEKNDCTGKKKRKGKTKGGRQKKKNRPIFPEGGHLWANQKEKTG